MLAALCECLEATVSTTVPLVTELPRPIELTVLESLELTVLQSRPAGAIGPAITFVCWFVFNVTSAPYEFPSVTAGKDDAALAGVEASAQTAVNAASANE